MFFFNDTATTEIYTLSLHDALPISTVELWTDGACSGNPGPGGWAAVLRFGDRERELVGAEPETTNNRMRSEEHTSELQSRQYLVCRLLLEKKDTYVLTHHPLSTAAL